MKVLQALSFKPQPTRRSIGLAERSAQNAQLRTTKQATRILRELTKDALKTYPGMPQPSTWLIRCLVNSHLCGQLESNWQQAISWTLARIALASTSQSEATRNFVELDGKTALFPNCEGFSIEDTHNYAKTLLTFLRRQPGMNLDS